jgi:hypothetical protein
MALLDRKVSKVKSELKVLRALTALLDHKVPLVLMVLPERKVFRVKWVPLAPPVQTAQYLALPALKVRLALKAHLPAHSLKKPRRPPTPKHSGLIRTLGACT